MHHKVIIVTFQYNECIDTPTHLKYLKMITKPINSHGNSDDGIGTLFEDIFSTHWTDQNLAYFNNELKEFSQPRFYPKNMTLILKAIDLHVEII